MVIPRLVAQRARHPYVEAAPRRCRRDLADAKSSTGDVACVRICIVTPGHLATNPRVVKEALALAEAGHELHVVHGHYAPWAAPYDAQIRGFATTRVSFGPHFTRHARYLRQSLTRRAAIALSRFRPLRTTLAPTAIAPVARDLAAATMAIEADLYIAHYVAALPAAARAARRHGGLYSFDAEDFHPGDLPDTPQSAPANRIISAIERKMLPGAAFVTAAAPGIADAYADRYGIARPEVILNVFPRGDAPAAPTARGTTQPGPSVYWFSQTIGADRGLECAVRGIAKAKTRPHLYLRGTPARGFAELLNALAAKEGVEDRIHLLAPESPGRMIHLAAKFDVGLVGETGETHNRRIALTNKQFTYLLAGIPMAMSDIEAHRAFVADVKGAAFLYGNGDPTDLAARLDALLGDPDALAEARHTAFRLGQERFNWECESTTLVSLVERGRGAL